MRVLLVDDDREVRVAIRLMLETAGHDVAEAGDAGVRAFRARPADVVLCDMFMPGRDGLELIRELRREFPDVRVVAMSGDGFNGTVDMPPRRQPGFFQTPPQRALAPGQLPGRFVLCSALQVNRTSGSHQILGS